MEYNGIADLMLLKLAKKVFKLKSDMKYQGQVYNPDNGSRVESYVGLSQ